MRADNGEIGKRGVVGLEEVGPIWIWYLKIFINDLLLRQGGMLSEEPVVTQVLKHWLIVLGGTTQVKNTRGKKEM